MQVFLEGHCLQFAGQDLQACLPEDIVSRKKLSSHKLQLVLLLHREQFEMQESHELVCLLANWVAGHFLHWLDTGSKISKSSQSSDVLEVDC